VVSAQVLGVHFKLFRFADEIWTERRDYGSPRGVQKKTTKALAGREQRMPTKSRKRTSKSAGRKSSGGAKKKSGRRYGPKSQEKVGRAMREMKRGKLKSGRSGKKVKSRKQAIAIGLSEARKSGAKVPKQSGSRKKSSGKRESASS